MPEQDAELQAYYDEVFIPNLNEAQNQDALAPAFYPTKPAQRYLQAHYTAPHDDFDEALAVNDAGDGSAWSASHAEFHPFFSDLVTRFDYEDALLVDDEGNVVYTAYKGVDLGTNLADGPFDRTNLAAAVEEVLESNSVDLVVITDLERYQPSYGIPTAWAVSLIGGENEVSGTILIQTVDTPQVARALRGETGELIADDYLGNEVLAAYTPLELGDLGWVVIAETDASEAFAPVDDFTRRIVLATAGIIVAVALASLLLAQIFSRPVKRLVTGVNRVAAGDLGAQVESSSTDEFADLAVAFNDMSRSLQTKQELLEAEQAEHQRLLLTMMPEAVAQRYQQGEQTIAQDHQDVAVVFADIVGFDDYAGGMDSASSLAELNEIVRQFDDAAEQIGVERVRTLRNGYLASCGLVLPRVDNALRALDFTREMDAIVRRFNSSRARACRCARASTPAVSRAGWSGDRARCTTCGATR